VKGTQDEGEEKHTPHVEKGKRKNREKGAAKKKTSKLSKEKDDGPSKETFDNSIPEIQQQLRSSLNSSSTLSKHIASFTLSTLNDVGAPLVAVDEFFYI